MHPWRWASFFSLCAAVAEAAPISTEFTPGNFWLNSKGIILKDELFQVTFAGETREFRPGPARAEFVASSPNEFVGRNGLRFVHDENGNFAARLDYNFSVDSLERPPVTIQETAVIRYTLAGLNLKSDRHTVSASVDVPVIRHDNLYDFGAEGAFLSRSSMLTQGIVSLTEKNLNTIVVTDVANAAADVVSWIRLAPRFASAVLQTEGRVNRTVNGAGVVGSELARNAVADALVEYIVDSTERQVVLGSFAAGSSGTPTGGSSGDLVLDDFSVVGSGAVQQLPVGVRYRPLTADFDLDFQHEYSYFELSIDVLLDVDIFGWHGAQFSLYGDPLRLNQIDRSVQLLAEPIFVDPALIVAAPAPVPLPPAYALFAGAILATGLLFKRRSTESRGDHS